VITRYLIALLSLLVSLQVEAQHFFEKSFKVVFVNGYENQVAYLQIPKNIIIFGTVEIQLTGGFNYQLNRGVLTKRLDMVYAGDTGQYLDQGSEITQASEPFASYWAIGDFDKENSRIPIYHLTSAGSDLSVKVRVQLIHSDAIAPLQSGLNMTAPITGTGGVGRQYRHFNDQRIGIGTTRPEYRLDVVGTARAHEIRVNTQKTADFVFEPDYQLLDLDSVKMFIQENKHLPGIPSAKQMEKEGVNVGNLQIDLLQKIEELTLHLIQATERAERQEKRIAEQEKRIKELENRL